MAAQDDLVSTTKGQVQTISQFVTQWTAPGQTLSTTASPQATVTASLGTTSILAIGSSSVRRAIEFHSSDPANSNIWLMPGTTAVVKRGIYLVPGSRYQVPPSMAMNNSWYAIASSGSTNTLAVVEFF